VSLFNKASLVNEISKKTKMSKASTERFIDALQDSIIDAIDRGDEVRLTGFISLAPHQRMGRVMKNPKTGENSIVPSSKTVRIKVSKVFKEILNSHSEE